MYRVSSLLAKTKPSSCYNARQELLWTLLITTTLMISGFQWAQERLPFTIYETNSLSDQQHSQKHFN